MKHTQFFQLMGLSALWGAAFLFIRVASPLLGPWVLAGLRVVMATLTLGALMWVLRQHWPWRHWPELLRLGLLAVALPFLLYAWAALRLPAGYMALINTTAVLFASVAAAWLGDDRMTRTKLLGCLVGFVGVALIVRLGPIEPTTDRLWAALACLLAAGCYGASTPLMKRATRHMEPLAIAMGMNVAAGIMLLPGTVWAWPQAQLSTTALLAAGMLGVASSGLASWMHLRIMRHVSPVAAISPAFMIPLFGVTWGHLVLSEPLGTGLVAGGALVLLATALVTGFNPVASLLAADAASPRP